MKTNIELFMINLIKKYDVFDDIYHDHIKDNIGEILPHLLMSEMCNKILSVSSEEVWVQKFLSDLELSFCLEDDGEICNVIAVSYVARI